MEEIRDAIVRAGVLTDGHFVFVDGDHALVKVEMDKLWDHDEELSLVLEALAHKQGLTKPDAILGVPRGGQKIVEALVARRLVDAPLIHIERVPGGAKRDFQFCSEADRMLAENAKNILMYEDVVSTLSSIAGVVKILQPERQHIESLAIWRRGIPKEKYKVGVTDFYLIEEDVPTFSEQTCPRCLGATS